LAAQCLLEVNELTIEVRAGDKVYPAVRDLSFRINAGEAVALVGESGSGKSLTAQAILGILPKETTRLASGNVFFGGSRIAGGGTQTPKGLRGTEIAMVFQDPVSSLNPLIVVGDQIAEMFREHRGDSRAAARKATLELMEQVGLPDPLERYKQYPHELSGGLRQRVMIAIALSLKPRLLIADEPTTALDVTIQAQLMDLILRLKEEYGLAVLLITHDLALAAEATSKIVVMYAGRAMEIGPLAEVYERPDHPYTASLLRAVPSDVGGSSDLYPIPGTPPDPAHSVPGCPFHPRCYMATPRCKTSTPRLEAVLDPDMHAGLADPSRYSACHYRDAIVPIPIVPGVVSRD